MNGLFSSGTINRMTLPNRFVRSATWEGLATEDGAATASLTDRMVTLAQGGVGLIISGHTYVLPAGQTSVRQLGIYKDELIVSLKAMTDKVHANNGKIVVQLAHAGFFAKKALTGTIPRAPSAVEGIARAPRQEMTIDDIRSIIEAFGHGAARARESGFDGVQIHAAHGYLLSQFLSPLFNRRTDSYGGELKNRARVLLEVLKSIRENVGQDYTVLIKMNCQDYAEDGLTLADSINAAVMLERAGLDAIEISGGLLTSLKLGPNRPKINSEEKEAYFKKEAAEFRKHLNIPLILVGGIRSYNIAKQLFKQGVADFFAMSRPFIREPDLIRRWSRGDTRKARCVSDNRCFLSGRSGEGIYCVPERKERQKAP